MSPWGPYGHYPQRRAAKARHLPKVRVHVERGRREVTNLARASLSPGSYRAAPSDPEGANRVLDDVRSRQRSALEVEAVARFRFNRVPHVPPGSRALASHPTGTLIPSYRDDVDSSFARSAGSARVEGDVRASIEGLHTDPIRDVPVGPLTGSGFPRFQIQGSD